MKRKNFKTQYLKKSRVNDRMRAGRSFIMRALAEAQDMLLDVTQIIEEGHCNPFRPKIL